MDLCPVHALSSPASGQPLLPKMGTIWRFAPMADPTVVEWHSRDLDSRASIREWEAVKDWKKRNKTYHIMRDNKGHGWLILAGMFGRGLKLYNVHNFFQTNLSINF
jgi:hypothetical protein